MKYNFKETIKTLKNDLINEIKLFFDKDEDLIIKIDDLVNLGEDSFNHLTLNEAKLILDGSEWNSCNYECFSIEELYNIYDSLRKHNKNEIYQIKLLKPENCIHIASLIKPDVSWKIIKPKHQWNGFDLIDENSSEENSELIFQIDYRDISLLFGKKRFRLYENLCEISLTNEELKKINNYINSL